MKPTLAMLLVFSVGLSTADDRPLKVQLLEAQFEDTYARRAADLTAKYRAALEVLLAESRTAGELESLLAIKAELDALDAADEAAAVVAAKRKRRFELSASTAITSGEVELDSEHGLLVSWKQSGGASWSLDGLAAGRYALTMDYYAGPFAGGTIRLQAPGLKSELPVKGGQSWTELKTQALGEITVAEGSAPSSLAMTIAESRAIGVLELKRVLIVPIR